MALNTLNSLSALFFYQVLSLSEADYFFDSLRQITDWSRTTKMAKDGEFMMIQRPVTCHDMPCLNLSTLSVY